MSEVTEKTTTITESASDSSSKTTSTSETCETKQEEVTNSMSKTSNSPLSSGESSMSADSSSDNTAQDIATAETESDTNLSDQTDNSQEKTKSESRLPDIDLFKFPGIDEKKLDQKIEVITNALHETEAMGIKELEMDYKKEFKKRQVYLRENDERVNFYFKYLVYLQRRKNTSMG